MMRVRDGEYPPNIHFISEFFPRTPNTFFCYGNDIYNPDSAPLPEDIQYHESIHAMQQSAVGGPDAWWSRYCYDPDFRLDQEVQAYKAQLDFLKSAGLPRSAIKAAREEMAMNLSSPMYALKIQFVDAERAIRKRVA